MTKVRKAAVAGMFYPGNRQELISMLDYLYAAAPPAPRCKPAGMVAPHAGYIYSGLTAAAAYQTVPASVDSVIVLSPSHREYFAGVCVYNGDAYETPLGAVPVNQALRAELEDELIFSGTEGHGKEHGIEVHLPFLQHRLGGFSLLPLVCGSQAPEDMEHLGSVLSRYVGGTTLLVASSDLSHFYSREQAERLDARAEARIAACNPEQLLQDLETRHCEACGGGPMAAVMFACRAAGAGNATVLHRTDSGARTGDTAEVVGYLSAVFCQ